MLIGNRYKLIDPLSNPGIGQVWIAEDTIDKYTYDRVAIKILSIQDSVDTEKVKEIFKRECDSLIRLKHPNIVKYLNSGLDGDRFYIVTEYFEGMNLAQLTNKEHLGYEAILKISIGILEGLTYAHDKNVIHRDLKPSNILVDERHNVKIVDFGISKIIDIAYDPNNTLKDWMTPSYASKEQLMRSPARPQSDLFSFGLIICYMLNEQNPPEDKNEISNYLHSVDCSDNLKELLKNLLHLEWAERPTSGHQVLRVIKHEYETTALRLRTYYVGLKNYVVRDLYELGAIDYSNFEHARLYVETDLADCKIYRHNSHYYLIGKDHKYQCEKNEGCLTIIRAHSFEDFISWEKESSRGMKIDGSLKILTVNQNKHSDVFDDFLTLVNDEERKRQVRNKREEKQNRLLKRWEKYLQEEAHLLQQKKKVCHYTKFEEDETGSKIIIYTDNNNPSLAKGDPIQLSTYEGMPVTVGIVDSIEGNQVTVVLNWDVGLDSITSQGKLGIDVIQAETSLKRFRFAILAIKLGNTTNSNLSEIINEPRLIESPLATINIGEPIQEVLNPSYKKIVERALGTKDIFLIQGPPGTGKTTVITEIVCQILKNDPNARILLTSQSHVAVDQALNKIAKLSPNNISIRIGRSEKISIDSQHLMMPNQLKNWVEDVKKSSLEETSKYLDLNLNITEEERKILVSFINNEISSMPQAYQNKLLLAENVRKSVEIAQITREWYRRLGKLEEFDEIFAEKASIVAATCLGIASRHALNSIIYDWVIVDEAARATAPELLVPLIRGKKIILVGDHRQLPPVVNSDLDKFRLEEIGLRTSDLEKSLFEEIIESAPEESKAVLNSQFRMHPAINKLIKTVFYPSEEIKPKKNPADRKHNLPWWPKTIIWFKTDSLPNNFEEDCSPSKRNSTEAGCILNLLLEIEKCYKDYPDSISVGVISGYDAQKNLLYNLIKPGDSRKWNNIKIIIDNVDAFQGSETDIVIYSVVRCNPYNRIGFLNDSRRLNVALSRGKTCLIIVGNARFIEHAESFRDNPFFDIIQFIRNNPDDCEMRDI